MKHISKVRILILVCLCTLSLAILFLPRDLTIWGHSMVPVIVDGDKVEVIPYFVYSKIMGKELNYNDIIVIKHRLPNNYSSNAYVFVKQSHSTEKENSIKRIVAKKGDRVRVEGGILYVNDERVEHNDINGETRDEIVCDGYYVLGDNAPMSVDSRHFGCITEDNIEYVVSNQEKYKVKLGNFEAIEREEDSNAN